MVIITTQESTEPEAIPRLGYFPWSSGKTRSRGSTHLRSHVHIEWGVGLGMTLNDLQHVLGNVQGAFPVGAKPLLKLGYIAGTLNLNAEFNV